MRTGAAVLLAGLVAACSGPAADGRRSDERARAPLSQRLASADVAAGALLFRQCAACHTIGDGAGDRDGPALHGVVGRRIAHGSGRYSYSAALLAVPGNWTPDKLDSWLRSPQRFAPGTQMLYPGLPNGVDRADVIAYLQANSPGAAKP